MSSLRTRMLVATCASMLFTLAARAETVAEQTLARVAELRSIQPSSDDRELAEANRRMDAAWTFFGANKPEALPVLREQLADELGKAAPNSLVLLDVGYFLFLQGDDDKAQATSALFALDPSSDLVRWNADEFFKFSHGVASRRDPRILAFIDKAFLREDRDVFIPQHALHLDPTLVCVFLYGVYGEGSEEHLRSALADPKSTKKALEILTWLGSPASVAAARQAYAAQPSEENFGRLTAYLMKAAGPQGRMAMLDVPIEQLDAASRAYYATIRPAVQATDLGGLRKQFGSAKAPRLSDSEVKVRLAAMDANDGRDDTTQPLSILDSTLPSGFLIDALVRIRAHTFRRLSDEALSDVEMTNALINALRYRGHWARSDRRRAPSARARPCGPRCWSPAKPSARDRERRVRQASPNRVLAPRRATPQACPGAARSAERACRRSAGPT